MLSSKKIFYTLNPKQPLAVALSFSLIMLPIQLQALPSGQRVVAGSASFEKTLNNLNITTSNKAIINYNSFNIGAKEGVRFIQPSANAVVLNRVIQANPSSILGSLNANGKVFLVNPAGIFFGANSVVNANSFLATTLNISDNDFLNGNYQFQQMKNMTKSYIIQKGSISVSPQGFVILTSPFVSSEGSIIAKAGHINIGATDNFYIQFDSNGLIRYDYQKNTATDDKPIVMPKAYADAIMDNVINTEKFNDKLQIVQNGDKIELAGGDGTAMVSGEINTDATADATAGTIEVKAQNNALLLNHAKLQNNAAINGNGGNILVYGDKFAYGDQGAILLARGGTVSGNGGFAELSAGDKVIFGGSSLDLHANNGNNGLFLIDPDNLEIASDSIANTGTDLDFQADEKITVDSGVTISTRKISGSDHLNDVSTGDSGSITMEAPEIELSNGSALLSFADNGFTSGDITLTALKSKHDLGTEAYSTIQINGATLKGSKIDITSTAYALDNFDSIDGIDDETSLITKGIDFFEDIPVSPLGLSFAHSDASVVVGDGSNIEGDSINIQSTATSQGKVNTCFTAIGIGWGDSRASAKSTVESGATLKSNGDISVKSNTDSSNIVSVRTVGLGSARVSNGDVSLALATTNTYSEALIQNGATVTSGGKLDIIADTTKNISASASAAAYDDGTVGVAIGITNSDSLTLATAGGNINANSLNVEATTKSPLIKTASTAGTGTGIVGTVLGPVNSIITSAKNFLSKNTPTANEKSKSNTKLAVSAALSYSDHASTTKALVGSFSDVATAEDISVKATNSYPIDSDTGAKGIKSSAIATVDNNDQDKKENAVAGAVAITKLTNDTEAYIGESAEVDAGGNMDIDAKNHMPYEPTYLDFDSKSDAIEKINTNLGFQDGIFTTWAQSNASGDQIGVSGSVNYFHMNNDTLAYIADNAEINQNTGIYGYVQLDSVTDIASTNISGVFGLKFFGAGGESGVGGAYLDIAYGDTTTAVIKDGVNLNADALSVLANSQTKNISIAEAGANAEKYGVSGTFSYLNTKNETYAEIQDATVHLNDSLKVDAKNNAKLINMAGGFVLAKNVGMGVSVALNDIARDTHAFINYSNIVGNGDSDIEAENDGGIHAYSLAGVVNTPLSTTPPTGQEAPSAGGKFGIGISGDASLNNIDDTTKTHVANSTLDNNSHTLNIKAKNNTKINSYTGSVSASLATGTSVGLAGSYSQNTLQNTTEALISNSDIISSGNVIINASDTGNINAYSASGSLSLNGASIAGSVSINKINSDITSSINSNSEVTSSGKVESLASDDATINTIAGSASFGGKAGIGSSFAKDDIENSVSSDITNSQVTADGKIDVKATQTSTIKSIAASLGASTGSLAAAVAITINTIKNSIKAYIDDIYGNNIDTGSNVNILATDSSDITSRSGELGGSGTAGFGASILYNTINNTIRAYLSNTDIQSAGNINIHATSDKTITAQSAGGTGAGTVAAAGSVLINTIEDTTKAYIDNSSVTTPNSISIQASQINSIDTLGGTLAGAGTLGIGGTVTVNTISNAIDAYVKDSHIKAGSNDEITILKDDGSDDTQTMNGLDILAYGDEILNVKVANLSGGGTAALGAAVSVEKIGDTINSFIDNSDINTLNSTSNALQDVQVRSVAKNDIDILAGGGSFSGTVGADGSSDTTLIGNKSQAYITGSFIDARNLVNVKNAGYTNINSKVVGGAASGVLSVAGNVAIVNIDNSNHSFVYDSDIFSDKDLAILASDSATLNIIAGSAAIGGAVGVGGSVIVTKTKQDTLAHVDNSNINAENSTIIESDTYADVTTYAATLAGGVYVGAGGAVTVNTIDATSKAYTFEDVADTMLINQDADYQNSTQDITIQGSSYSSLNSTPGAISGGIVGVSGSVDVATIKNTVLAEVGSGTDLYAGRNLLVRANSDKRATSNVIAFAGGLGGVSGAVSIANINSGMSGDGVDASENTQDSTNDLIGGSKVEDQLGDTDTATSAKAKLDADTLSVDSEFSTTQPNESVFAKIGSASVVEVGRITSIKTMDFSDVNLLTGTMGAGVVGAGGGVSIANIGSNARASIDNDVVVESNDLIIKSDFEMLDSTVESYAAGVGAVGLGAAVSILSVDYENDAFIDNNSYVITHNDMTVDASTDLSSSSKAYGAAAGAAAGGLVKSKLAQSGTTQSFISDNVHLKSTGNINVTGKYDTTISTLSQAAAGGIVSGSGSLSYIYANPIVNAVIRNGVNLQSDGTVTIGASASGSLLSEADGVNIGGLTVGVSKATAFWTPIIKSQLGSSGLINLNNLNMYAHENVDSSGNFINNNVKAKAFSAVGSLYGGSGSLTEAKADSVVKTSIGSDTVVTATDKTDIKSKSYSKSDAQSDGFAFALCAAGFTGSKSTNNAVVSTTVGADTSLSSENAINISSYSEHEALAHSRGGAGGLLSDAGTKATVNMNNDVDILINDGASLLADNGDINIEALANLYSNSVSTITTDGGITLNESEANSVINQNVDVVIGSNTILKAQDIDISAKVNHLENQSSAYSKTIAADSKSKAYSNLDVTSNAKVHVKSSSQLTGYHSISIQANQDNIFSKSYAKARIDAGVTGSLDAKAHNDLTMNSNVEIDSAASLTTQDLYVEATAPQNVGEDTYYKNADAEANTIVYWTVSWIDKQVKKWYDICCLGWIAKWVWTKVKTWVEHILNSDVSATTSGSFTSNSKITMNGDMHQLAALSQVLNVANDGTITTSGNDISGGLSGNDVVVNDLVNHNQGKIVLNSSGEVEGNGNIYLSNSYPDVTITNASNKNLLINQINPISDNSGEPNIKIYADDGEDNTHFNFYAENPSHTINIQNSGTGDIIFNKVIDNYTGDMSVSNTFGNILAEANSLIKTSSLSLEALRGDIGSTTKRVNIELQKNKNAIPSLTSSSFGDTYLGIKLSESLNNEPALDYVVSSATLNQIKANGLIDVALKTANVYWTKDVTDANGNVDTTIETTQRASQFNINNIDSRDNILINGENGVSLALDGTMKSGDKDLQVAINDSDPSLTTSEYIDTITATDINLKPISQTGGSIAINLADGTFTNNGETTLLDGYMYMNIENSTDKNLNLSSIDIGDRVNGSFTVNGISQEFTATGYDNGQLDVTNNGTGVISIQGDILNPTGSINITGNNGIFNPLDNYILAHTVSLTTQNNTIGTLAHRMIVDGALSTTSSDDVFIHNHDSSGLLIDKILATGATAYLDSTNTISDTDTNDLGVNIQAKNVELEAANDIGVSTNDAIILDVKNIAANSQNGAVYLKNNSDATVTTVGSTTGLHAANDISYEGVGTLTQVNGANIISDTATINLSTTGDMQIDYIEAPQHVTLTSNDGHITENGDSETDIKTQSFIVYAANGIGDDGVTENSIDTDVERIDARNTKSNNLNTANLGNLELIDMNGDGYALYNAGGSINVSSGDSITLNSASSIKTDSGNIFIIAGANDSNNIGAFTQLTGSSIYSGDDIRINAIGDILLSYIQSTGDVSIYTRYGDILGDENILLNLNVAGKLNILADAGVVGTPGNTLSIAENNGGVFVQANTAKNLISVFIKGINQPLDRNINPDLSVFNNRPISGSLIDRYLEILYNGIGLYNALEVDFQNTDEFKKPSDLIESSL